MNWGVGANCFLLKSVQLYGKDWDVVSSAMQTISKTFMRDERLQDLSTKNCSLQYNYMIASMRQRNSTELDEKELLKLAVDHYTALRREQLHTARLDLLKSIKIVEEDAERLRAGHFSEIPSSRLTIYRRRCQAFGIVDIIGEHLKLEPLPPMSDSEAHAIRISSSVHESGECLFAREVVDKRGGLWLFTNKSNLSDMFGVKPTNGFDSEMVASKYLCTQSLLAQSVGTEQPEEDASSIDTSSTIRTHPETDEICSLPEAGSPAAGDSTLVGCTSPLNTDTGKITVMQSTETFSPTISNSVAPTSDSESLNSPSVCHKLGSEMGSESSVVISAKRKKRNVVSAVGKSIQSVHTDKSSDVGLEKALSPFAPESIGSDGSPAVLQALSDARRWRRGLLASMSTICMHRHAYVFLNPVTEEIAPGYSSVVYEPVDLTSVRRRMESALSCFSSTHQSANPTLSNPTRILIDAASHFVRDLQLMFVNARMYNNRNHEVHKMAGDMYNDVLTELCPLWAVLAETIPGFPKLPAVTSTGASIPLRKASIRSAVGALSLSQSISDTPSIPTAIGSPKPTNVKPVSPSLTRSLKRQNPEPTPLTTPLRKRHKSTGSGQSGKISR